MQLVQRRRVDHAQDGLAVLDERDVDGELAILLDELAGTVERIHQPVASPVPADVPGHVRRLLRQHRNAAARRCRPATIRWCEAMSASVSGERSSLCETAKSCA
jgi:hypothetical protein